MSGEILSDNWRLLNWNWKHVLILLIISVVTLSITIVVGTNEEKIQWFTRPKVTLSVLGDKNNVVSILPGQSKDVTISNNCTNTILKIYYYPMENVTVWGRLMNIKANETVRLLVKNNVLSLSSISFSPYGKNAEMYNSDSVISGVKYLSLLLSTTIAIFFVWHFKENIIDEIKSIYS